MTSFAYAPFNLWMQYSGLQCRMAPRSLNQPHRICRATDLTRRAVADCIAVMSACPQDKNPINGHDAVPSEFRFSVGA